MDDLKALLDSHFLVLYILLAVLFVLGLRILVLLQHILDKIPTEIVSKVVDDSDDWWRGKSEESDLEDHD